MSIGLLITTCEHYFTNNIPNIIKNIEECNFPKENVLIVSGQESLNSIYYENNIKIVKVDYTGLHLTGLIYMYENIDLFRHINYWIILPDTIKLDKLFYIKIMKYYDTYLKNKEIYSLPFINPNLRPTMDMGIININHICNMSDYLKKIKKVRPYNKNDVLKLKKQLIFDENTILGLRAVGFNESTKFEYMNPLYPIPNIFLINKRNELIKKQKIINNQLCNEVYLYNIDLFKYQRNFNGPGAKLVMDITPPSLLPTPTSLAAIRPRHPGPRHPQIPAHHRRTAPPLRHGGGPPLRLRLPHRPALSQTHLQRQNLRRPSHPPRRLPQPPPAWSLPHSRRGEAPPIFKPALAIAPSLRTRRGHLLRYRLVISSVIRRTHS